MSNKYPRGTFDLVAIQDCIYTWITSVCQGVLDDDVQVIWRNQGEPLPARPCVTLKLTDGPTPVGRSGSVFLGKKGAPVTVGIQAGMTLSVQVFGNTEIHSPIASQLCIDINSSLMDPEVLYQLSQGGIGVQGVGAPRNLSALEETEYEERYGIDVALGVAQNITSKVPTIETVNITGSASGKSVKTTVKLP